MGLWVALYPVAHRAAPVPYPRHARRSTQVKPYRLVELSDPVSGTPPQSVLWAAARLEWIHAWRTDSQYPNSRFHQYPEGSGDPERIEQHHTSD